jgi:hypothetical protein
VDNSYFITEDNVGMLKLAKEAGSILVRSSCTTHSCHLFLFPKSIQR